MKYDFIVVGAGSAGCVLANRLSASGKFRVLLLEAGGSDSSWWLKIPVGFAKTYYNPQYNWMYSSEPETNLENRRIYAPRGKVVGGSGAINAMIYVRGHARDFDDWEAAGNPGWGYRDVLPYFKKIESHPLGDTAHHGSHGLIGITQMKHDAHPICGEFLQGCEEAGFVRNEDFNGAQLEGAGIYEANIRDGLRDSSAVAYLKPARTRLNLSVEVDAEVQSLLFDSEQRAIGVVLNDGATSRHVYASREVIVAAGAVGSPKLLQLSGLGDQAMLARLGIPLTRHLPAVGRNLQDHLCVSYYYKANRKTLNDELGSTWGQARAGLQYLWGRRGPLALSVNQAGGFFKGDAEESQPNLQLYFNPLSYTIPKDPRANLKPEPYSGFLMCFNPCRPTSRGTVEITSADASSAPAIRPNYLSTEQDRREAVQGSQLIRRLMQTPSLSALVVEEVFPAAAVSDEESMLQFFREQAGSIYHLCGTCAMGPDNGNTVVDGSLKVHGIAGLRVIDASIFPNITSGNTNAATMMVAEKGADMILAEHS